MVLLFIFIFLMEEISISEAGHCKGKAKLMIPADFRVKINVIVSSQKDVI